MNTYWQMVLDHFYQVPWVHLMVSLQWFFMAYFVAINLAYLVLENTSRRTRSCATCASTAPTTCRRRCASTSRR